MIKIMFSMLGAVISLFLILYMYSFYLLDTRTITRAEFINARAEKIYDLAIDAKNQPLWRPDVSSVTMNPDGKSWVEHTQQGNINFRFTAENRPSTFSLSHEGPGFKGEWTGRFTSHGSGTEVVLTESITIKNPGLKILSRLFKFTEHFMDNYIKNLKTMAEK